MATKKKTAKKKTVKRKTAKKTAKVELAPPSPINGQRLQMGNPGNSGGKKGRSGRKPMAWKALCKDILEDEETQKTLRRAAADSDTSGYPSLLKLLSDHAAGVPEETINVKTESPREKLNDELTRLAATKATGKATK